MKSDGQLSLQGLAAIVAIVVSIMGATVATVTKLDSIQDAVNIACKSNVKQTQSLRFLVNTFVDDPRDKQFALATLPTPPECQ